MKFEYFREVQLLETLKVSLSQAGHSEDDSRFLIRNEIYRSDGKLAARVTSAGGWLDLSTRRLVLPPESLLKAMQSIPKTDDFQMLTSSIK